MTWKESPTAASSSMTYTIGFATLEFPFIRAVQSPLPIRDHERHTRFLGLTARAPYVGVLFGTVLHLSRAGAPGVRPTPSRSAARGSCVAAFFLENRSLKQGAVDD